MTSGPVYVGAFVLMLFILGCFIVKGPMKWALLELPSSLSYFHGVKTSWDLTDFFIRLYPNVQ